MIGLMIAAALTAQAGDWPDAGDWSMARGDDRCITSLEYEGPGSTELLVSLELDGSNMVLVTNSNWSAVADRAYPEISVTVDQSSYGGSGAVGHVSQGYRPGFVIRLPASFLDDFAKGRSLRFHNGEALVDSLKLEGSAAAAASLRRCISTVKRYREAEERDRRRLEHIPTDPFAQPIVTADEPAASAPIQWSRSISPEFPERALSRGITTGSATLDCTVSSNGSPESCRVVAETPPGAGFGQAALRAIRSSRLSPRTVDARSGQQIEIVVPFEHAD